MKLDYAQSQLSFWQDAPDRPGYKHVYAASFGAIMYLLSESGKRSITLKYAQLNGLLKLSEEAYSESLKWLDGEGFIVYFKGKGRNAPATVFVSVPELTSGNAAVIDQNDPILHPEISGCTGGGNGGSSGGGTGVSKQEVAPKTPISLPPHPPIEENNISPTQQTITGESGGRAHFRKPSNIVLSPDEEADLLATYGPDLTARMLLLVSAYKREQGGKLKSSDFINCVKWAAVRVKQDDQQALTPAPERKNSSAAKPHVPSRHVPSREFT